MDTLELMQKESLSSTDLSSKFSQVGNITDASLNSLRDQIKNVMIPLLIKIFQLKLELNQAMSLPSRLQTKSNGSPAELLAELTQLDEDLKSLELWCESARNQIAKAKSIPGEERSPPSFSTTNPTTPPKKWWRSLLDL